MTDINFQYKLSIENILHDLFNFFIQFLRIDL